MTITTLPLGYLQTNCYLLTGTEGVIAIDPGAEPQRVLSALGDKPLAAILLTHGHFDHVGAVRDLAAETGCDVYLCREDLNLPQSCPVIPFSAEKGNGREELVKYILQAVNE